MNYITSKLPYHLKLGFLVAFFDNVLMVILTRNFDKIETLIML